MRMKIESSKETKAGKKKTEDFSQAELIKIHFSC